MAVAADRASGYRQAMPDSPLLVFGPRSTTYDFGPGHPLTPRRFGPGIDLLRALGAEPGLQPEPAADEDLLLSHTARYVATVRRLSKPGAAFDGAPGAGFASGDNPPFPGMHDAAASVAGGSLRGIEAIIGGRVEHAFHPGGGLHHAMAGRASGFCIYDDPALAIARARRAGLRVLYVDLDVHHGDGVEAIHAADPGVLTVSFHESGRYLFPGTGFVDETGDGAAAGSVVNVPLEPGTGETAWLEVVTTLVPELAAAFAPDIVVSQHGSDTHAWDPLAHLNLTTTAMGRAARLVDRVAHLRAGGRWLSTGGGGYGVYGVVPRAWAHVWLAAAHREAPERLPEEWRDRWEPEAARYADAPLSASLDDPPNAGLPADGAQQAADARSLATGELARRLAVPRLIRVAAERAWWSPMTSPPEGDPQPAPNRPSASSTVVPRPGRDVLERLVIAPRIVAALDALSLRRILLAEQLDLTIAVAGNVLTGLVASHAGEILAVGVTPAERRMGLASTMLRAHVAAEPDTPWRATVTLAERDPAEPIDRALRGRIARGLFEAAGFSVERAGGPLGQADPEALEASRPAGDHLK